MSLNEFNNEMNDLEFSLLQQFRCMSTSNKDDLIQEFQKLVAPNKLNNEECEFFLDMNNWNLQQAICSYFDYDAHKMLNHVSLPEMSLVNDVTIGEGEEIPPNTQFVKTWRIANTGTNQWPTGCYLTYVAGSLKSNCERVMVQSLKPEDVTDVSVHMVSPQDTGTYQGQWRMCTNTGQFFGDIIWVIITVADGGLLGLTQQMSSLNFASRNDSSLSMSTFGRLNRRNLVVLRDAEMQIDEENQKN